MQDKDSIYMGGSDQISCVQACCTNELPPLFSKKLVFDLSPQKSVFLFFQAHGAVIVFRERESEIHFFCSFLYFHASVRKIAPHYPKGALTYEVGKAWLPCRMTVEPIREPQEHAMRHKKGRHCAALTRMGLGSCDRDMLPAARVGTRGGMQGTRASLGRVPATRRRTEPAADQRRGARKTPHTAQPPPAPKTTTAARLRCSQSDALHIATHDPKGRARCLLRAKGLPEPENRFCESLAPPVEAPPLRGQADGQLPPTAGAALYM